MRYLDKLAEARVDRGLTKQQKIQARIARSNDAPDELAQKARTGPVGDMARSIAQRKVRVEKARSENESPETKKAETFAKNRKREAALKNLKASNELYNLSDPNEKPKRKRKSPRKDDHTSYQQIGAILAEMQDGARAKYEKQQGTKDIIGKMNTASEKADAENPPPPTKPGIRNKVADKLDSFARKQYRRGEVDDASGKPTRAELRGRAAHAAGKAAQMFRPKRK